MATYVKPKSAAERSPKAGDPVLFYGKSLNVAEIHETGENKMLLAKVGDVAGRDRRDAAIAKIHELRAGQTAVSGEAHAEIASQVAALDKIVSEAFFWVSIRVDLLSWWEDRGVWVSEGRILSDDQQAVMRRVLGKRIMPDAQRDGLLMFEALPAARVEQILAEIAAEAPQIKGAA